MKISGIHAWRTKKKDGMLAWKNFDWFKFHVDQNIVSFGTVEKYLFNQTLPKRLAQVGGSNQVSTVVTKFHWWYVGTQHVQMQRDCNVKKNK